MNLKREERDMIRNEINKEELSKKFQVAIEEKEKEINRLTSSLSLSLSFFLSLYLSVNCFFHRFSYSWLKFILKISFCYYFLVLFTLQELMDSIASFDYFANIANIFYYLFSNFLIICFIILIKFFSFFFLLGQSS